MKLEMTKRRGFKRQSDLTTCFFYITIGGDLDKREMVGSVRVGLTLWGSGTREVESA